MVRISNISKTLGSAFNLTYYNIVNNQMGKKTKSKQRLDKFYHYAKAQGYRSRAAYKLIQLNRKYNFLSSAFVLIDLCAAPGGWMQVAAQFMPLNSTIVGVDLDPIKKVPGTRSFKGDITTPQCYEQLRKELKGGKCDVVLNDGAPNVGANWSKDAYTQSELVLSALKLACSFLKENGFFITKVFRSTDFQSLMWVFKKFFQRVEATKPEASRFSSAEIFVVCSGYLAPTFIDEQLFDAKCIFKDTEADHFHSQLAGEITSIDKLLTERKNRGGYEDNAPMHLYKETTLTNLIEAESPLLIFAEFNRIKVSAQETEKYLGRVKTQPADLLDSFLDLKVLGKREVGSILKWRGKLRQIFHKEKTEQLSVSRKNSAVQVQPVDSEEELQKEVLHMKKKQIRQLKLKQEKKQELLIKSQLANKQHEHDDEELNQNLEGAFEDDIENLEYVEGSVSEQDEEERAKYEAYDGKRMEQDLQEMYEARQQRIEEKKRIVREARENRKDRRDERHQNTENKLKSRNFRRYQYEEVEEYPGEPEQVLEELGEVKFHNPLVGLDDEDIYISDNEESYHDQAVDPDEKMEGEVSDDEAYKIPKPMTDMELRRKQLKKKEMKKERQLKKDIVSGEETNGIIEIVKNRQMEDYNIDELAETLAIAKKMIRNRPREDILDYSYGRYSFEDHDDLPKWFSEDEKRHNFKKEPITKEEFKQERDRLMAINARVPKKILEAKVRRKLRTQKKLKKTQKIAEAVMSQQGVTEVNKLRQVSKIYDKSKMELKEKKQYVVSLKGKTAPGKDKRNVKHVDKRMKKDKRSLKVKKTRQIHRRKSKPAKF